MAQVFIGSSSAALPITRIVAGWLSDAGHTPLPWDKPGLFRPETSIHEELNRIAREVDGAIFIFAADDTVVESPGGPDTGRETVMKTRDNVVFETGLFAGSLGGASVRRIIVGEPRPPSDMLGIVHLRWLPEKDARDQTVEWAGTLLPVLLKSLSHQCVKTFEAQWPHGGDPVLGILDGHAPRLIANNPSDEIKAVCSNKGKAGLPYYELQFKWVRTPGRSIRRIFLRERYPRANGSGFSRDERGAILRHLAEPRDIVQIRWVYKDEPWVGESFGNSLGFAIFGDSWLLHWGTERGMFYEPQSAAPNAEGLGKLLSGRFDIIWEKKPGTFQVALIEEIERDENKELP